MMMPLHPDKMHPESPLAQAYHKLEEALQALQEKTTEVTRLM